MKTSYTITEEEYISANKLFTRLSFRTLTIYGIIFAVLAAIAFLTESPAMRIGAIGAIVGGFIGDLCFRKIYAPIQTKKQFREYKAAQEPMIIILQDDGINFEAAIGNAMIDWDRIIKWRENEELILIFQAPQVYHIVPRRIGELADNLAKALAEKVGASA